LVWWVRGRRRRAARGATVRWRRSCRFRQRLEWRRRDRPSPARTLSRPLQSQAGASWRSAVQLSAAMEHRSQRSPTERNARDRYVHKLQSPEMPCAPQNRSMAPQMTGFSRSVSVSETAAAEPDSCTLGHAYSRTGATWRSVAKKTRRICSHASYIALLQRSHAYAAAASSPWPCKSRRMAHKTTTSTSAASNRSPSRMTKRSRS